jgi:hypothetical protein
MTTLGESCDLSGIERDDLAGGHDDGFEDRGVLRGGEDHVDGHVVARRVEQTEALVDPAALLAGGELPLVS